MCAVQRNFNQQNYYDRQNYNQPPLPEPQQQPQPRYRFRWPVYLGLPLAGLLVWLASGINIALIVSGIMCSLGLIFADKLAVLACFGILCITLLSIIKVLRK